MLAQSRPLDTSPAGDQQASREPDNHYCATERYTEGGQRWWVVHDPATRLAIAEFRYLASAIECCVLLWAGDCFLPVHHVLPLRRFEGYGASHATVEP